MNTGKRRFTADQKSAVAHGWARSGLRQADYALQHGISARLLRSWIHKHVHGRRWDSEARLAVHNAINALTGIMAAMEPAGEPPTAPPAMPATRESAGPALSGDGKFSFDDIEGSP